MSDANRISGASRQIFDLFDRLQLTPDDALRALALTVTAVVCVVSDSREHADATCANVAQAVAAAVTTSEETGTAAWSAGTRH